MRFPEFSGEWERCKVKDFTKVVAGATPSTSNKEYWGGDIRWMNSGELNLKRVYEVQGRITQLGYEKTSTKIIPPQSVLIGLAGQGKTRGTAAINYVELCTNQSIASILPSDKYYPEFLYQNIESRYKELRDISSGDGGRGGLNLQMIYNLNIPYCSISEQRKIGDFLCLLDQRIETQRKIIEKYESLIRGLCEKLTRQGATNKTIAECLECHSSTLQESAVLDAGSYPVYGAIGICGYTDTPDVSGDGILIIKDGASVGVTYFADGSYSSIGTLNRLTAKEDINLRYIYYCLKVLNFTPYKTGLAIPHIYFKDYGKHKIWCPSLEQQSSIADALTTIDNKIQVEKSLLEQLNSQKRYMLNQLFI